MCALGKTWLKEVAAYSLGGPAVVGEQLKTWIVGHIWAAAITVLSFVAMVWYFFVTIMPGSADGANMWALGFIIVTLSGLCIFVLLPLIAIRIFVGNANKALQGRQHHLRGSARMVAACMALMSLLYLLACAALPPMLLGLPLLGLWYFLGRFPLQLAEALQQGPAKLNT